MEPTMNPDTSTQNPMPEAPTPVVQAMPHTDPQPVMPTAAPVKKNSFGPLIGAAIIILILIAGALYFWSPLLISGQKSDTQNTETATASDSIGAETQVSAAAASIDALQANIDQDLNALGN